MTTIPLTLAANNAAIGGGEVMLLAIAEGARTLGAEIRVVGPGAPDGVLDTARDAGFDVVALPGDRRDYVAALRSWDRRHRDGVLWCVGLVPALATARHGDRVVHLHQRPLGAHLAAARIASRGAVAVLVPSHDLARRIRGSEVLWNWTADHAAPRAERDAAAARAADEPVVLGFLGRPSPDKGLLVLAAALAALDRRSPGRYRLLVAGEPRFVKAGERQLVEHALRPVRRLVTEAGWVDPGAFFREVDIAVFPSVWDEPFGLVVAEAMSAGVPFVVSDAGALPEVAGPDHPWVVPRGDAAALAAAVEDCALADPGRLRHTLAAARARWEADFSPAAGLDRLAPLLARLGVLPGGSDG